MHCDVIYIYVCMYVCVYIYIYIYIYIAYSQHSFTRQQKKLQIKQKLGFYFS